MTRRTIEIAVFCAVLLLAILAFYSWLTSRAEEQRLQATLSAQQKIIASADASERSRTTSLNAALAQIEKLKRANQTPQQIAAGLQKYLSLPQPLTLSNSGLPRAAATPPLNPQNSRQRTVANSASYNPGRFSDVPSGSAPNPINPEAEIPPGQSLSELSVPFVEGCVPPTSCATKPAPASPALPSSSTSKQSVPSSQDTCVGSPNCAVQIPSADLKPLYSYVQDCRECQLRLTAANQNLADDAKKIAALTSERDAAVTAAKGGTFWHRVRQNLLWFAVGAAVATAYNAKH